MKRETWMTELPEKLIPALAGITARKFRKEAVADGDRSVWTDTPADKAKKAEDAVREHRKRLLQLESGELSALPESETATGKEDDEVVRT